MKAGLFDRLPRPRATPAALAVAVVSLTILASLAGYVRAGRSSATTISSNYVPPRASVFDVIPVESFPSASASVFEITFALSGVEGQGIWTVPQGSRLLLQVGTGGRSAVFRIEAEGESGAHESRTERVSDRGWLDVGAVPAGLRPGKVLVRSESGVPFSFRIPLATEPGSLRELTVRPFDVGSPTGVATFTPRYRIVEKRPVPAREALSRLFFFPSSSRVLLFALVLGLFAVIGGIAVSGRYLAVCVLLAVSGVALLHAGLRPPLRGEDETSHVATVEVAVWGTTLHWYGALPRSLDRVVETTRLEMNQFDMSEGVPVTTKEERSTVRAALRQVYAEEATDMGGRTPLAMAAAVQQRGRFYYPLLGTGRTTFRSMGLLDRFSSYRIVSTLLAVGLFGCGLALLRFGRMSAQSLLLYGCGALVPPYLMSLTTTVSNYSMAIGLGLLLAAAIVAATLSDRTAARVLASAVLVFGSVLGVGVWTDFLLFVPVSVVATLLVGAGAAARFLEGQSRGRAWAAVSAGAILLGASAVLVFRWVRPRFSPLESFFRESLLRRPVGLPDPGDPVWFDIVRVVAMPALLATLLALLGLLGRRLRPETRERLAFTRSGLGLLLFVVLFFVTPFGVVPTDTRLEFLGEVRAHWNAFFSTTFSLTQDTLSWKMYWGVFGWADTKYPDLVYALAKWLCVALFISLPILCRRFARERPRASAALLFVSGAVVSLAFASNTLRYFAPNNPWGRYILPWVPIALFAALARIDLDARREAVLRWIFVGAVCFHLWTAIYVVGVRYFIPR